MSDDLPGPTTPCSPSPTRGPAHRILHNSALNLGGQGVNAVCQLVVVFALARGLGKAAFGEYYTLFALIMVTQLIVEAGLSTLLTYRIVHAPESWKETLAEAAGLFLVVVAVSMVVLIGLGCAWVYLRGDEPVVLIRFAAAACACAAIQVQRFSAGVFRAFEMFGYENFARALQGMLLVGLVLAMIGTGVARVEWVLVALAASHVASALFLLAALQYRWWCLALRFRWSAAKQWLSAAVPVGLGDVVRGLTWQLDTLLMALFQPPAVVGIYSVAYRPLGPLNWLPRAVLTAAFPSFARLAASDRHSLDRAFANSIRLLWIISLPIVIAICMCAEPIITLLAGAEYLEAAIPMRILIWIAALSYLSIQFRFLFTAVGRQDHFVRLVVIVFLLEAVIETLLIPQLSYFGACAGSFAGELFFTVVGLAVCRHLGVGSVEWGALMRAVLAGTVMGALVWFARQASLPLLLLAVVLSTAIYLVLCLRLGALQMDELRHLCRALMGLVRPGFVTAGKS